MPEGKSTPKQDTRDESYEEKKRELCNACKCEELKGGGKQETCLSCLTFEALALPEGETRGIKLGLIKAREIVKDTKCVSFDSVPSNCILKQDLLRAIEQQIKGEVK